MLLGSILQFRFPDHRIDNPIAALQRTFLGKHVPVEAFQVNMTTLSPQKLCSHLQGHNPGARSTSIHRPFDRSSSLCHETAGQSGIGTLRYLGLLQVLYSVRQMGQFR